MDGDGCSVAARKYSSEMGRVVKLGIWGATFHFLSTGVMDLRRCAWVRNAMASCAWNVDLCSCGDRRDDYVDVRSPMADGDAVIYRGSPLRCESLPSGDDLLSQRLCRTAGERTFSADGPGSREPDSGRVGAHSASRDCAWRHLAIERSRRCGSNVRAASAPGRGLRFAAKPSSTDLRSHRTRWRSRIGGVLHSAGRLGTALGTN